MQPLISKTVVNSRTLLLQHGLRPVRHLHVVNVADTKQQQQYLDNVRPAALASTAVLCISTLLNPAALPSVKLACAATALGAAIADLALGGPPSFLKPSKAASKSSSSSSSRADVAPSTEQVVTQIVSNPLFPAAAAAGAAGAAVLSVLLPAEDLPALSSLCLLASVGPLVLKQQQQQQQKGMPQAPYKQVSQQTKQQIEGLQQQLQSQTDKARTLSQQVQQLQRELKQARKGTRKTDSLKDQLKQEQAEKQELAFKVLFLEQQLQQTQEKLEAQQALASRQASQLQAYASSQAGAATASTPTTQQPPSEQAGAVAANAARPVAAFVGGRKLKESDRKIIPLGREIRFFGSPRDTGAGDLRRLEAAIKAGLIDEVYMITRWNGHGVTQQVTRLCKDRGIPCHLLDAGEKARRKQEWEEATLGSDTEAEWELP